MKKFQTLQEVIDEVNAPILLNKDMLSSIMSVFPYFLQVYAILETAIKNLLSEIPTIRPWMVEVMLAIIAKGLNCKFCLEYHFYKAYLMSRDEEGFEKDHPTNLAIKKALAEFYHTGTFRVDLNETKHGLSILNVMLNIGSNITDNRISFINDTDENLLEGTSYNFTDILHLTNVALLFIPIVKIVHNYFPKVHLRSIETMEIESMSLIEKLKALTDMTQNPLSDSDNQNERNFMKELVNQDYEKVRGIVVESGTGG